MATESPTSGSGPAGGQQPGSGGTAGSGKPGKLTWNDPRTVVGLVALVAFLAFIGYLSSRADSWSRLLAVCNLFVPIVTAVIGGVFGVQVTAGRISDAKQDKAQAQQRQAESDSHLKTTRETLVRAQTLLERAQRLEQRRAADTRVRAAPELAAFTDDVDAALQQIKAVLAEEP